MSTKSFNIYFTCCLLWILWGIIIINTTEDLFLGIYIISTMLLISIIPVSQYRQFLYSSIFILLGSIGWLYYWYILSWERSENIRIIDRYEWQYVPFTWEVHKLYRRSDFYDEYILKLYMIQDTEIFKDIYHILRVPKNFSLIPGSQIRYQWKVYPIEDFDGFAYEKYMLSSSIYFSTSTQSIERVKEAPQNIRYHMYVYREQLLRQISSIFPQEEAIFLWGILFWARENIPQDLKEDFNNSWLTHFIAVSGFNITLCVIFVTFLFGFLPAWVRIITVSSTIIWFSLFVGLWAPVVRAAIMGILGYIFLQGGNSAKNITVLLFAAVCMSLYSPLALSYDVSLHLSFLAVIGIIYTQDFFQKIFYWIPSTFAIREAFVLTLAALSFSLPIMMFQFWQVSLLAPFANIAVTWTIPLAMLAGALTIIIDSLSTPLGMGFWFITWILLHYDIQMVRFFWNIEWALLRFDFWPYAMYLQILYFIILSYTISFFRIKKKD